MRWVGAKLGRIELGLEERDAGVEPVESFSVEPELMSAERGVIVLMMVVLGASAAAQFAVAVQVAGLCQDVGGESGVYRLASEPLDDCLGPLHPTELEGSAAVECRGVASALDWIRATRPPLEPPVFPAHPAQLRDLN